MILPCLVYHIILCYSTDISVRYIVSLALLMPFPNYGGSLFRGTFNRAIIPAFGVQITWTCLTIPQASSGLLLPTGCNTPPHTTVTCSLDLLMLLRFFFGIGYQNPSLGSLAQWARNVWVLDLVSLELHLAKVSSLCINNKQQQQQQEGKALIGLVYLIWPLLVQWAVSSVWGTGCCRWQVPPELKNWSRIGCRDIP